MLAPKKNSIVKWSGALRQLFPVDSWSVWFLGVNSRQLWETMLHFFSFWELFLENKKKSILGEDVTLIIVYSK